MNSNDERDIVAYKLYRANDAIEEVAFLLEHKRFTTAINRLYYGCFYAVTALLYTKGILIKRHSAAIQMFGLHFVSTGLISRASGKFYSEIFEMRQDSDYESFIEFEEQEVVELLPLAKNLISEIEQLLTKQ
jgi:uncharacterized protein (UPF0332 family)